MKVILIGRVNGLGPKGSMGEPGTVCDVDPTNARRLIDLGYARAESTPEPKSAPKVADFRPLDSEPVEVSESKPKAAPKAAKKPLGK